MLDLIDDQRLGFMVDKAMGIILRCLPKRLVVQRAVLHAALNEPCGEGCFSALSWTCQEQDTPGFQRLEDGNSLPSRI